MITLDPITLTEALRYNERKAQLNSERTIREYERIAQQILAATRDAPLRCTSQGKWLQVKAVANRLKQHKIVPTDYPFYIKPDFKKPDEQAFEDKVLTEEQFQTLLRYLPRTDHGRELARACQIAYYGGLRGEEVTKLRPKDVTILPAGSIVLNVQGKGSKKRKAYLPQAMRAMMERFAGLTISYTYIVSTFARIIRAIRQDDPDFPKTTFHGLRHSFATHRLTKGTNAKDLQKILGHSSMATTMIYVHALNNIPESMRQEGY